VGQTFLSAIPLSGQRQKERDGAWVSPNTPVGGRASIGSGTSHRPNLPSQMPSGSAEIIQRSRGLIGQEADPNHIITAFVNDDISCEHCLPERIVVAGATEDRDVG